MSRIIDTKIPEFQQTIQEAPLLPGCYIYRDAQNRILYIGKAKVLRNRVRSYFNNYPRLEQKIQVMIHKAASVEFLITDSEVEALILENSLIKKYKPRYNSMLVDDKTYIYVKFPEIKATKPGQTVVIPTIETTREKHDPTASYFGPYPDAGTVKRLLKRLRRIYPYCTSKVKVEIPRLKSQYLVSKHKPCFYAQIGLCNGACAGHVTRGEYERNINNIKKFFAGQKQTLLAEVEKEMRAAAKEQRFEDAARYRNMLNAIKYVGSNLHIDKDSDETVVMKEKHDQRVRAVDDLVSFLEFPNSKLSNKPGFRIECYDISNIQGKYAVGSMVVFIDGLQRPDMYRRFRIKLKNEPNDFAMLQEVLTRRFRQLVLSRINSVETVDNEGFTVIPKDLEKRAQGWKIDESFSEQPDLMIIDGGKGQLSSTYRILRAFGLEQEIPMVGLAKRAEEIFKVTQQFQNVTDDFAPDSDQDFSKIWLPRTSEALYLVQRIRDEAHRFAITYHRKLRSKSLVS